MGFAEKHLNPDEELLLNFKPHWKALVPSILWTILIAAALGASLWLVPKSWQEKLPLGLLLTTAALVVWLILALPTIVAWLAAEYVLTDERLVARTGVFRRVTYDIPVDQINSVTIRQGFIDRLLRVGDLVVESASQSGDAVLRSVPRPTDVQNMIARAKDPGLARNTTAATADANVAGGSLAVGERLEELEGLHSRGLVTDAEYAAKRSQLLGEL